MKKLFIFCAALLSVHGSNAAPSDYFRTIASGEWNDPAIWESSADNITWVPTGAAPNSSANTITIRNTHSVFVSNNQDMDQVVIENGAILSHLDATLTINDGPGNDIHVQNGGAFTLAADGNAPVFASSSAVANIDGGGILRLSATGLTFAGTGVHVANYVYQHASILEYTLSLAFATSGVTYFPNVNAATIPIFRIISNVGNVGAAGFTTINGIFEANGNITFQNTGIKTFRNGITGTGNVDGSTSGRFVINGSSAVLGGTGMLTLPAAGMDIGSNTNLALTSDKSVTGNVALLSNALLYLGSYDLDITAGSISGGSAASHVVTNGSGKLIYNNVTATPRIYPVGANASTINPMAIFNGGGFNYGVRVETGINPPIAVPLNAVNRTWFVTPSGGTPATVNTNFFYATGDGNAGFNYTSSLELGHHTGVWNVIQTNIMPAGSYQVATTVSTFGNNIEAPLVLGNLGSILSSSADVSVHYFTGVKQNAVHLLRWQLGCANTAFIRFEIQRSIDGVNYNSIHAGQATALQCAGPFSYSDLLPAPGSNYYRLKITGNGGEVFYSQVVVLINGAGGLQVMKIVPNPVHSSFDLRISIAQQSQVDIRITDMQGRLQKKETRILAAGFHVLPVDVRNFASGNYLLTINTATTPGHTMMFTVR